MPINLPDRGILNVGPKPRIPNFSWSSRIVEIELHPETATQNEIARMAHEWQLMRNSLWSIAKLSTTAVKESLRDKRFHKRKV